MKYRHPDYSGQKFGKLVAIEQARNPRGKLMWQCLCDCGNETLASPTALRDGIKRSCGCLRSENMRKLATTHGLSHTHELYSMWCGMKTRCSNPNFEAYPNYGGRGIRVCERWLNFQNFIEDMHPRPSKDHSIDRIDNDGDYCPENCRWSLWKEQMNNSRNNTILTVCGISRTLTQWASIMSINYGMLQTRVFNGWPPELAIFTPVLPKGGKFMKKYKESLDLA